MKLTNDLQREQYPLFALIKSGRGSEDVLSVRFLFVCCLATGVLRKCGTSTSKRAEGIMRQGRQNSLTQKSGAGKTRSVLSERMGKSTKSIDQLKNKQKENLQDLNTHYSNLFLTRRNFVLARRRRPLRDFVLFFTFKCPLSVQLRERAPIGPSVFKDFEQILQ